MPRPGDIAPGPDGACQLLAILLWIHKGFGYI